MVTGKSIGLIVLALGAFAAHGAETPADASAAAVEDQARGGDDGTNAERYRVTERALYDTLSMDASPQIQVLAGRANLSDEDESMPSVLRPKRADVIARAAQFGAGDAFVQWMAASQGSFTSSQCGASVWPETEVANLLRLEPDNAAAWQFAVALEAAQGSQSGVDDALAQMASASTADDHFSDELKAWQRVYAAHPELVPPVDDPGEEGSDSSRRSELALALDRLGSRDRPALSVLETVCKHDAQKEITWQRAAWCADAATVFATRGTSLALRDQGLRLLAIVGDRSPEIADLQRTQTWLTANSANGAENYRAMEDTESDRASDWRGNANDVVATQRRLKRLGQSLTAPGGWVSPEDQRASDERAAQNVWRDYLRLLVDAMRSGNDPDAQAAAAVAESTIAMIEAASANDESATANAASDSDGRQPDAASARASELVAIARSHPDSLMVQWLAASSGQLKGESLAAAVANVQRLEPDNAAAWALSLSVDASAADADVLRRAAEGKRFDSHTALLLRVWLDAVAVHPPPPEVAESLRRMNVSSLSSGENAAIAVAMTMAFSTGVGSAPVAVSRRCLPAGKTANDTDREPCIAASRLMLRSATSLLDAMIGESISRKLGAMNAVDEARAAAIKQWRNAAVSFDAEALANFVREYVATGSEIEAIRIVADRDVTPTSANSSK